MKILFIHQNFPGQFKFLAPALAALPAHEVWAMTMQKTETQHWQGIKLVPYSATRGTTPNMHPWVSDFETKTIRAEACFRAALKMKTEGFTPDVIVAHHGWGESLFLKEVCSFGGFLRALLLPACEHGVCVFSISMPRCAGKSFFSK